MARDIYDETVDWVAVERACKGERLHLTSAERQEAVRRLTAQGLSARAIGELLRMTSRSVVRRRSGRTRQPGPSRRTVPLKPCGTLAAAKRHWRRGERCCPTCLEALRPIWRDRNERRKQEAR